MIFLSFAAGKERDSSGGRGIPGKGVLHQPPVIRGKWIIGSSRQTASEARVYPEIVVMPEAEAVMAEAAP
jgi:hypothetical protein